MASNNTTNHISKKPKLILKCSKVTKKVRSGHRLLKECSFSAYKGEIVSILAPDHNSKTTFAKIICGLVPPSNGEITIRGHRAGRHTNQYVSYQPEIPFVSSENTVSELMNMYSRFFRDFNFKRSFKLLKQFKISPRTKFENLSITAIQIVETVLVSSRKTSLYVFDDPLVHVDPKYRSAIANIIESCKKNGSVIVFSQTPDGLGEISDKAIILKNGEIYLAAAKKDFASDSDKLSSLYKEVFRKNA